MSQQNPEKQHSFLTRLLMLIVALFVAGGSVLGIFDSKEESGDDPAQAAVVQDTVVRDGQYSDKEHVAAYIHTFNALPDNYITKQDAAALGWDSSRGNLWDVAPGKSIGGDVFSNYEGQLPKAKNRVYHECDIDYEGGYRNAKRIVFSNDGLIYYTDDHYETFEEMYNGND